MTFEEAKSALNSIVYKSRTKISINLSPNHKYYYVGVEVPNGNRGYEKGRFSISLKDLKRTNEETLVFWVKDLIIQCEMAIVEKTFKNNNLPFIHTFKLED